VSRSLCLFCDSQQELDGRRLLSSSGVRRKKLSSRRRKDSAADDDDDDDNDDDDDSDDDLTDINDCRCQLCHKICYLSAVCLQFLSLQFCTLVYCNKYVGNAGNIPY